jgi:hypothetical protein
MFSISTMGVLQTKVYKIGSCYSARKTVKESWFFAKTQFNIIEVSVCFILRR